MYAKQKKNIKKKHQEKNTDGDVSQQKKKYGRRGQRPSIVFKSLHSDIIAQAFHHAVNVHVIV